MRVLNLLILIVVCFATTIVNAASVYVLESATGTANGTDWANAYTDLPASLTRGDTYYIGDGSYASYSFDDAVGDTITIKKATVADHGTETGWNNSFGDGKAVFDSTIAFTTGNWILDGNGTHTVPSKTATDYGFEVYNATTNSWWGIVQISSTNITLKYVHVHGQYTGADNSGTVGVRWTLDGGRTKIQNCYVQNTGKDGLQLSGAQYVLVERCYLERMGTKLVGTPDVHAQSVQMFYGASDCVFRWNKFDRCEGQSLIAYAGVGVTTRNLRFYGNVVFNAYGTVDTAGFNSSGGIIGNAWEAAELDRILIYNNNWVNLRDEYTTAGTSTHFPIHPNTVIVTNVANQNNILYNSKTSWLSRGTYSHNASGGYGTNAGSLNEQMSLDVGVFQAYTSDDFRLVAPTDAGVVLSGESWWNDDSDEFFGSLDSNVDMYGTIRGSDGLWDRGAFEYKNNSRTISTRSTIKTIYVR